MDYLLHIAILTLVFAILSESLDLALGHTGLLVVCQAAFFGLGAYTSALLTSQGYSFLTGVAGGAVLSGGLSLVVAMPTARLKQEYFAIGTFGLQVISFTVLNNWVSVTRGPMGISNIPPPTILGWRAAPSNQFLLLVVIFTICVYLAAALITTGPFGRVLHAIREDEVWARVLGKNTLRFKITAVAVSAIFAATAGSLYAHYLTYIDPTSFTVMDSIVVIAMVAVGGAGSLWGPLIGALIFVALPELLRFIGVPAAAAANIRQMVFGGLLVIVLMIRPRGIVGSYSFRQ
jgi:branched-chain amino acid transport system permease protein